MRWDGKTCSGKPARFTYPAARQAIAQAAKDGPGGWRMPAREELVGLVDRSAKKPQLDAAAFPKTPTAPFWATRAGSDDNLSAWLVNSSGRVHGNTGQAKFPLRLVRAAS